MTETSQHDPVDYKLRDGAWALTDIHLSAMRDARSDWLHGALHQRSDLRRARARACRCAAAWSRPTPARQRVTAAVSGALSCDVPSDQSMN
jgi:hypothetical protein